MPVTKNCYKKNFGEKKNSKQQNISTVVKLLYTMYSQVLNGDINQSIPSSSVLAHSMVFMCNKTVKKNSNYQKMKEDHLLKFGFANDKDRKRVPICPQQPKQGRG